MKLSSKYHVRKLKEEDVETIYDLMVSNPLYYQYCPPQVTKESILEDMVALPPKKTLEDKYYLGFFDEHHLVAVMDLIYKYPNDQTAFIGFFMMNQEDQGKGVGSQIIEECCLYLKEMGFDFIRLGFVKGNPQSETFWIKNGFIRTDIEVKQERYTVVVMQKEINQK